MGGTGLTLVNCYNAGTVSGSSEEYSIGVAWGAKLISNSYYMTGSAPVGIGNSGTGEVTEKEEADMQTDTFLEELKGSTDNTAWKRDDSKNNKMPILSWQ